MKSINVQPRLLAELMAESEPSLFANKSPVATSPVERELPTGLFTDTEILRARLHRIARWHAEEQVRAWRDLVS